VYDTRHGAQGKIVQAGCSKKIRRNVVMDAKVGLQIRYKGGLAIAL